MKNSAFSVQLRNENRANFRKLGKRELSLRGTIGGRKDDWEKRNFRYGIQFAQ